MWSYRNVKKKKEGSLGDRLKGGMCGQPKKHREHSNYFSTLGAYCEHCAQSLYRTIRMGWATAIMGDH